MRSETPLDVVIESFFRANYDLAPSPAPDRGRIKPARPASTTSTWQPAQSSSSRFRPRSPTDDRIALPMTSASDVRPARLFHPSSKQA
jgi:hypothetical protein